MNFFILFLLLECPSDGCNRADEIHDLNEVHKLEYINMFDLVSYRVEEVPYGVNYFGKVRYI